MRTCIRRRAPAARSAARSCRCPRSCGPATEVERIGPGGVRGLSAAASHALPQRLLAAALLAIAALAGTAAAGEPAASPSSQPPPGVRGSAPTDEITISAPEPRYVAPTTRDRIGRVWAPVYLDGYGPFRLVLDTGASGSVVIERVADALGWRGRTETAKRVRGVTGTMVAPVVRVGRMEIGDLVLAPALLPIVQDVFGGADGVLGSEGLQDKRIVIDFKGDSISIRRSRRERPGDRFQTLPMSVLRRHLLVVDVQIGRVAAKAILATGAPTSLGNMALLEALRRRAEEDTQTDIVGVTLDVEQGNRVRMPTIRMGDVALRNMTLTFGDVHLFQHWRLTNEPALMLGMDVLGVLHTLIIDYRTKELHLRTSP